MDGLWCVCVRACACVCVCEANGWGGYSIAKNYCYLPGRRGKGGDKKLLQLTGRETEGERVNQACEKSCFDGGRCCKFGYSE